MKLAVCTVTAPGTFVRVLRKLQWCCAKEQKKVALPCDKSLANPKPRPPPGPAHRRTQHHPSVRRQHRAMPVHRACCVILWLALAKPASSKEGDQRSSQTAQRRLPTKPRGRWVTYCGSVGGVGAVPSTCGGWRHRLSVMILCERIMPRREGIRVRTHAGLTGGGPMRKARWRKSTGTTRRQRAARSN